MVARPLRHFDCRPFAILFALLSPLTQPDLTPLSGVNATRPVDGTLLTQALGRGEEGRVPEKEKIAEPLAGCRKIAALLLLIPLSPARIIVPSQQISRGISDAAVLGGPSFLAMARL